MERLVYVGKNKKDTSKKKIRLSEKAQRVYGALALASMLVVGKVAFENISEKVDDYSSHYRPIYEEATKQVNEYEEILGKKWSVDEKQKLYDYYIEELKNQDPYFDQFEKNEKGKQLWMTKKKRWLMLRHFYLMG